MALTENAAATPEAAIGEDGQVGVGGKYSAMVANANPGEEMALTDNAAATPGAAIGEDGQVGVGGTDSAMVANANAGDEIALTDNAASYQVAVCTCRLKRTR